MSLFFQIAYTYKGKGKKDGVCMIKLQAVSHDFIHQFKSRSVLNDISLEIHKGEIFGLIGETGSGKSTLLRIMNGFIEPTKGQVFLNKRQFTKENQLEMVKETSMLFQHFNLLANLTVVDNVLLPMKIRGLKNEENLKKAQSYLNYVGLDSYEHAHINTLSGGQKQRVAIARTLMSQPKIIFCDEPTSALDNKMRDEVLDLLKSINRDMNTTIVIVSHDISVIKSLCDRAAILEFGKIEKILEVKKEMPLTMSFEEALSI